MTLISPEYCTHEGVIEVVARDGSVLLSTTNNAQARSKANEQEDNWMRCIQCKDPLSRVNPS